MREAAGRPARVRGRGCAAPGPGRGRGRGTWGGGGPRWSGAGPGRGGVLGGGGLERGQSDGGVRETPAKPLPGAAGPPAPLPPPAAPAADSGPGRGGGPCGCRAHSGREGALQRDSGGSRSTWKAEVGGNTLLEYWGCKPGSQRSTALTSGDACLQVHNR